MRRLNDDERNEAAARLAASYGVSIDAARGALKRWNDNELDAEQWLRIAIKGGLPLVSDAEP